MNGLWPSAVEVQPEEYSGSHPEFNQDQNGHVARELAHVCYNHQIRRQRMRHYFASRPFMVF